MESVGCGATASGVVSVGTVGVSGASGTGEDVHLVFVFDYRSHFCILGNLEGPAGNFESHPWILVSGASDLNQLGTESKGPQSLIGESSPT